MSGWQPIETAPKDGTKVLVWIGEDVRLTHWDGRWWSGGGVYPQNYGLDERMIKCWHPLPPPPDSAAKLNEAMRWANGADGLSRG